jgi:hypothetical protein
VKKLLIFLSLGLLFAAPGEVLNQILAIGVIPDSQALAHGVTCLIQIRDWSNKMKNCMAVICTAASALALSFLLVGCDRQVSHTESSSVSSDGTVKSKEKSVTQSSDGTVTKTEESKKTTPPEKP